MVAATHLTSTGSAQVRAMVHLGANACIVGRNASKTTEMAASIQTARAGSKVLGIGNLDVRSPEQLAAAAKRCADELGGIDYVIAGAAGNFLAPISQVSENAFKSVIDIDLLGSWNTAKATLPYLVESAKKHKGEPGSNRASSTGTGGRIIFISATMHYLGATPFQVHASAAKAAVDSIAAGIAVEYGPRGVTSNVIAPGPIAGTEGMERLSTKTHAEDSQKDIPVGRWGRVKEIADASVFLFSDTGDYVNGAVVVVDGGHWRIGYNTGKGFKYPDFLLSDAEITGVKGGKKAKI